MIEGEGISQLWPAGCDGKRPWPAVLQQLSVLDIRMAYRPVREERAAVVKKCRLRHECSDRTMDVSLADNGDAFIIQKRVCSAWHDPDLSLEGIPALYRNRLASIFPCKVPHRYLQHRDCLGLRIGNHDIHLLPDVTKDAFHRIPFILADPLHLLSQLRHRNGGELDIELLKKLSFVAHR